MPVPRPRPQRAVREGSFTEPAVPPYLAEAVARAAELTRPRACAFCDGEGEGQGWRHDPACVMA